MNSVNSLTRMTTTMSSLKKSPRNVVKKVNNSSKGIYVLKNNQPAAVMLSVSVYENMVNKLDSIQEKLFDMEVSKRLHQPISLVTDQEVRGERANTPIEIDPDDGWE